MAGLFDDLIPAPTAAPTARLGLFDDLVPPRAPYESVGALGDVSAMPAPGVPAAPETALLDALAAETGGAPELARPEVVLPDLPEVPDVDQSSFMGDLSAAGHQAAQIIPAARAGLGVNKMQVADRIEETEEMTQARDMLAAMEEALPTIDPEDREQFIYEMDQIRQELAAQDAQQAQPEYDAAMERVGESREEGLASLVDALPELVRRTAEIQKIPMNPAAQAVGEAETFGEGISAAKEDPLGVLRTFGVRSLGTSVPSMLAAIAGQAAGGPLGAAGAGGAVGGGIEASLSMGQQIEEVLRANEVDTSSPEALAAFITENPEEFQGMVQTALTRAGVIGGVDALTGGVTGRMAANAAKGGRPDRIAATIAAGGVVEPIGEGAGEAGAQLATTGEIEPGEVLAEIVGGAGMGVPTTAGQVAVEAMRRPQTATTPSQDYGPPEALAPLPEQPSSETVDPEITTPPEGEATAPPPMVHPTPLSEPPEEPTNITPTEEPTPPTEEPPVAAQPEPTEQTPSPEVAGPRRETVFTPEDEAIEVEHQVVEASDVLTSDQEGYPAELQPRDRDSAASQAQIERIANKPNPQRLGSAPETDRGSPIIGPDGNIVESGNGRIMGLRRAYERGTADEYRAWIEENYPEAAGMKNPVLVRRRVTATDEQNFTQASNKAATLSMSAAENARSDARKIDDTVLSLYRGGNIGLGKNRDMVRAFISKLTTEERGALITPEGGLSIDGQQRFQRAVFHRAYGDDRLLSKMADTPDPDLASIINTMAEAAPAFAQLKAAIERGEVSPEGDIAPYLTEAIQRIADMRTRDEDLAGFRQQIDAFSEPVDPITDKLMGAFYNEAGTRLASKKAMQDFLQEYAAQAMKQKVDQIEAPGIEPTPLKGKEEIVDEVQKRDDPDEEQTLLDAGEGTGRQRPDQVRSKERREGNDQGRKGSSGRSDQGTVEDSIGRKPKGKLSPRFLDFSFTNKTSVYGHAFEAAGKDPMEARNLPIADQLRIVKGVLEDTFGVKVDLPTKTVQKKNLVGRKVAVEKTDLDSRRALDQLLDAYRQMGMLASIMGLPETAMGLELDGKPLILSLVSVRSLRGALGMFGWGQGERRIYLPGRSNSFAHEWGHALDHFMATAQKRQGKGMLTRDMDSVGVQAPLSPWQGVSEAFSGVMNALYGDRAKLNTLKLQLQVEAAEVTATGQPTPKAKKAIALMSDLKRGKRPPAPYLGRYFDSSKEYDDLYNAGGYFTDPAEMFARAFEAWVGVTVANISDLPQSFLSKGEWGYTSNADSRQKMTFPKEADMLGFDAAMSELNNALHRMRLFGPQKALAPADNSVYGDNALLKRMKTEPTWLEKQTDDWRAVIRTVRAAPSSTKAVLKSTSNMLAGVWADYFTSLTSTVHAIANKNTGDARTAFRTIADMLGNDPGSGRLTATPWQQKVEMQSRRWLRKLDGALMKHFRRGQMTAKQNKDLRDLLTGQKVSTSPEIRELASDLRGILNNIWYALQDAGIEVGFADGFLPRIMDVEAVDADGEGFVTAATELYSTMFEEEVINNDDAETQAKDIQSVITGLRNAKAPNADGDLIADPQMSQADEDLITAWRDAVKRLKALEGAKNPKQSAVGLQAQEVAKARAEMLAMLQERFAEYSARNWRTRIKVGNLADFETIGPNASFLKGRKLPPITDKIMEKYFQTDVIPLVSGYAYSAARRGNYAKMFGAQGEKLKVMLDAAEKAGASSYDVGMVAKAVNSATGRFKHPSKAGEALATTTFFVGTIGLLGRATFASLAEPIVAGMRSGEVRDSFNALVNQITYAVRRGKRRDLFELSKVIGLTTSSMREGVMENRLGADSAALSQGASRLLSQFFQKSGLTPLTNFQRVTTIPLVHNIILRNLRRTVNDTRRQDFADGELNEMGIGAADRKDLLEWLEGLGHIPGPDDLLAPNGEYLNPAAELWAEAIVRFTDGTIQNPQRSDRPIMANHPQVAPLYGIMSFIMGFHRNVLVRNVNRILKDEKSISQGKGAVDAQALASLVPAIGALYLGQLLATVIREALFNREKWQELDDDDDEDALSDWLMERAFYRTGLTGAFDPILQLIVGVKYERDMTAITAGPYLGYQLQNMQRIIQAFNGRNSANTNTTEWQAVRSMYQLLVQPLVMGAATAVPGGFNAGLAPAAGIWYGSAPMTSAGFADWLVGPKGTKHEDPDNLPWWELGDGTFK